MRFWPLNKVLVEKYDFSEQDANYLADFLTPILDFVPDKRPSAVQLLQHPWINAAPSAHPLPVPPLAQDQPPISSVLEKQQKEKDDKDAMAVGLGNIAIDGNPKSDKRSSTQPKPE